MFRLFVNHQQQHSPSFWRKWPFSRDIFIQHWRWLLVKGEWFIRLPSVSWMRKHKCPGRMRERRLMNVTSLGTPRTGSLNVEVRRASKFTELYKVCRALISKLGVYFQSTSSEFGSTNSTCGPNLGPQFEKRLRSSFLVLPFARRGSWPTVSLHEGEENCSIWHIKKWKITHGK